MADRRTVGSPVGSSPDSEAGSTPAAVFWYFLWRFAALYLLLLLACLLVIGWRP